MELHGTGAQRTIDLLGPLHDWGEVRASPQQMADGEWGVFELPTPLWRFKRSKRWTHFYLFSNMLKRSVEGSSRVFLKILIRPCQLVSCSIKTIPQSPPTPATTSNTIATVTSEPMLMLPPMHTSATTAPASTHKLASTVPRHHNHNH